jgi:hypothetical protein
MLAPLWLLALHGLALADQPLGPPSVKTTCSNSGAYCALADSARNTTQLFDKRSAKQLWSIPGWHRWVFVADDGRSMAVGYDGMNLLPMDVRMNEPVLRFYHQGKLTRTLKLSYFYANQKAMTQTVSHWAWVRTIAEEAPGELDVALVDGRHLRFNMRTGDAIKPALSQGSSAPRRD